MPQACMGLSNPYASRYKSIITLIIQQSWPQLKNHKPQTHGSECKNQEISSKSCLAYFPEKMVDGELRQQKDAQAMKSQLPLQNWATFKTYLYIRCYKSTYFFPKINTAQMATHTHIYAGEK